jgi:hypothetical protein
VPGIDGKVELHVLLDSLSSASSLAAAAPRGTGLAGYLSRGIATEMDSGSVDGAYWSLTVHLIQQLSIWWPPVGYAHLPVMTPWCIRDRSARYDQGPESWGAPRSDGYLRDDNSIIKKLPLPLTVNAPDSSPYGARKPWRGFTACHIWRDLEDGTIGGVDQWIYRFMPNLVWLPSPLSSLSDHHPRVQELLQRTSQSLFRGHESAAISGYTDYVWRRLVPSNPTTASDSELDLTALAMFSVDRSFIERRLAYIDKFITAADEVLSGKPLSRKIICTRYTVGMPRLDGSAVSEFRVALDCYRTAVRRGIS